VRHPDSQSALPRQTPAQSKNHNHDEGQHWRSGPQSHVLYIDGKSIIIRAFCSLAGSHRLEQEGLQRPAQAPDIRRLKEPGPAKQTSDASAALTSCRNAWWHHGTRPDRPQQILASRPLGASDCAILGAAAVTQIKQKDQQHPSCTRLPSTSSVKWNNPRPSKHLTVESTSTTAIVGF
jgi:hypothetical protein